MNVEKFKPHGDNTYIMLHGNYICQLGLFEDGCYTVLTVRRMGGSVTQRNCRLVSRDLDAAKLEAIGLFQAHIDQIERDSPSVERE